MEEEFENEENIFIAAKDIKKALKLENIDTALLILIAQDIDTIRYHNCN